MDIESYLPLSPRNLSGKLALVTGASSGIGLATAIQLASEGCQVILVARRGERLAEIKESLLQLFPEISVSTVEGSITDERTSEKLREIGAFNCDFLINNAGLARGTDFVEHGKQSDWDEMIDTNIKAAFGLSRSVLPQMLARGYGHIIQLASIAGHSAYEGGSVYCATKHALLAFTKAMRLETCGRGVRITAISPGLVETEFSEVRFHGDTDRAKKVYAGLEALTARDVASQILWALKQPSHINLDEITMMPIAQGGAGKVVRSLS